MAFRVSRYLGTTNHCDREGVTVPKKSNGKLLTVFYSPTDIFLYTQYFLCFFSIEEMNHM